LQIRLEPAAAKAFINISVRTKKPKGLIAATGNARCIFDAGKVTFEAIGAQRKIFEGLMKYTEL